MPTIDLPIPHPGQVKIFNMRTRFNAVRCGRRWGKTQMLIMIACNGAMHGESWGIFAPDYKILSETYKEILDTLRDVIEAASEMKGVIRLIGGGRIDFWTLNNPRAGRSRKYHGVLIDEAGFSGPDMMGIWEKAIRPALLDYVGDAWVFSTPNGVDDENFFYQICSEEKYGFTEFHAPTSDNPYLPVDELEKLEADNEPRVYMQEYLALFVSWAGTAFFSEDSLTRDGHGVDAPTSCDMVFAIIDTAVKDGLEHDGTAVIFCAKNRRDASPLTILDWDVLQIEGRLLETWLPNIYIRLEELAKQCGARYGSGGAWIEDKVTGTVLIQHARAQGHPAQAIDSKLTAIGKEARAISASSYVYRGEVKMAKYAYEKTTTYRGKTKNHLLHQVCTFRMGAKTLHTMDLLDCFTYSVMIGLGNSDGF